MTCGQAAGILHSWKLGVGRGMKPQGFDCKNSAPKPGLVCSKYSRHHWRRFAFLKSPT
jgi:hypothetical protein